MGKLKSALISVSLVAGLIQQVGCIAYNNEGSGVHNTTNPVDVVSVEKVWIGDRFSSTYQLNVRFSVGGRQTVVSRYSTDSSIQQNVFDSYLVDSQVKCLDTNCNGVAALITARPSSFAVNAANGDPVYGPYRVPTFQMGGFFTGESAGPMRLVYKKQGMGEIPDAQSVMSFY